MKPLRRHRCKGSYTIESALVLLMFLVIFFSIGDFAQVFLMHNTLVERARAAARGGAVNNYTDDEIRNMVLYGTRVGRAGPGSFGMTAANVQISRTGADADARVSVGVSNVTYRTVLPLITADLKNLPVLVVVSSEEP